MAGGYVHNIDPIFADFAGVHLWWYGLGFALGFFHIHRNLLRDHLGLGLTRKDAWTLATLIALGALIGGRAVEIAFDEWIPSLCLRSGWAGWRRMVCFLEALRRPLYMLSSGRSHSWPSLTRWQFPPRF
jgi:hypothetical protein